MALFFMIIHGLKNKKLFGRIDTIGTQSLQWFMDHTILPILNANMFECFFSSLLFSIFFSGELNPSSSSSSFNYFYFLWNSISKKS